MEGNTIQMKGVMSNEILGDLKMRIVNFLKLENGLQWHDELNDFDLVLTFKPVQGVLWFKL
jgi:hypothetical protein